MASKRIGSTFAALATLGVVIASCVLSACASADPAFEDDSPVEDAFAAEPLGTLQQGLRRPEVESAPARDRAEAELERDLTELDLDRSPTAARPCLKCISCATSACCDIVEVDCSTLPKPADTSSSVLAR